MNDIYDGREQTLAKHYILEKYLEKLTFKLLGGGYRVLTYVDGFSGPWESETSDYSDTSFMIAIRILESVHKKFQNDGDRRQIRCFLVEKDPNSYQKLSDAVLPHNDPANGFYVRTYCGNFEDAIPEIRKFVGASFALTFIDPTGWTGYSLKKIEPILRHEPSETIVNFMFDHVSRFVGSDDPAIVASFDPILGGPNWKERLDKNLAPGRAAEKLFKENLKSVGQFKHVLSTVIEKTAAKRPHFALAYGTRNPEGLKVFRDVEFQALRAHEGRRLEAKQSLIKERTGQGALFGATELPRRDRSRKSSRTTAKLQNCGSNSNWETSKRSNFPSFARWCSRHS